MSPKLFWFVSLLSPMPLTAFYFYSLVQQQKLSIPFIAISVFSALILVRWNRHWHYPTGWTSSLFYLSALILLGASITIWSPWLGTLSLLSWVASFLASHTEIFHSEKRKRLSRRSLLYLGIPLLLILRLPLGWEAAFHETYLEYTSSIASYWLDTLNTPHFLDGQILELPQAKIEVEAVSGNYQTLLAMILVSLVLFAWFARPIFVAPFYVLAGLISAAILQTLRLTIATVALDRFSLDLTIGSSLILFQAITLLGMLAVLYSFDALIMFLFAPVSSDTIHVAESNLRNPLKVIWNRLLRRYKSRRNTDSHYLREIPPFVLLPLCFLLLVSFGMQVILSLQS